MPLPERKKGQVYRLDFDSGIYFGPGNEPNGTFDSVRPKRRKEPEKSEAVISLAEEKSERIKKIKNLFIFLHDINLRLQEAERQAAVQSSFLRRYDRLMDDYQDLVAQRKEIIELLKEYSDIIHLPQSPKDIDNLAEQVCKGDFNF